MGRNKAYYTYSARTSHKTMWTKNVLRILMGVFLIGVMGAIFGLASTYNAHAQVLCGTDLGYNTKYVSYNDSAFSVSASDVTKMTIQDLYSSNVAWTTYNGTNNPDKLDEILSTKDLSGVDSSILKKNSQTLQGGFLGADCALRTFGSAVANVWLGFANGITSFTSLFVTKAVDPTFICPTPQGGSGCINLLAVIAGTGQNSSGGIIGRLYSGLYLNLIVLFIIIGVLMFAWQALVKRNLSRAWQGLGGTLLTAVLGVGMLANPLFFAELPMKATMILGSCIVQGINGQSCLNDSITTMNTNSGNNDGTECSIESNSTDTQRRLSLVAQSASCTMWKAFVLEPWTVGQFGVSYEDLYYNSGTNSPLFNNTYMRQNNINVGYWTGDNAPAVSLYARNGQAMNTCDSTNSAYKYRNLALYQLNVMSNLHTCGETSTTPLHSSAKITTDSNVYRDWAYIADTMAKANETAQYTGNDPTQNISYMWSAWTGSSSATRVGLGFMAFLSALIASFVLISTSVLAITYSFMSVFLITFAPMFLLIGVVPGQGRRIMLGWIEQVVSNILKYMACVLWLVVTIELYGAVLGNNAGIGGTFIFLVIVSMAMYMYRKEFINMLGVANMGGTQFSNSLAQRFKDTAHDVGRFAKNTSAGAVAGFITGDGQYEDKQSLTRAFKDNGITGALQAFGDNRATGMRNLAHRATGATNQAGYTAMQNLKRGNNMVSNMARAMDKVYDSRRVEARKLIDGTMDALNSAVDTSTRNLLNAGADSEVLSLVHEGREAEAKKLLNQKNAIAMRTARKAHDKTSALAQELNSAIPQFNENLFSAVDSARSASDMDSATHGMLTRYAQSMGKSVDEAYDDITTYATTMKRAGDGVTLDSSYYDHMSGDEKKAYNRVKNFSGSEVQRMQESIVKDYNAKNNTNYESVRQAQEVINANEERYNVALARNQQAYSASKEMKRLNMLEAQAKVARLNSQDIHAHNETFNVNSRNIERIRQVSRSVEGINSADPSIADVALNSLNNEDGSSVLALNRKGRKIR